MNFNITVMNMQISHLLVFTGGDIVLDRDSRLLQSRRRVARTLLVLAFVFAICWMPYNLCNLLLDNFSEESKRIVSTKVHDCPLSGFVHC